MNTFTRILFAATLAAFPIATVSAQDPHGGKPPAQDPHAGKPAQDDKGKKNEGFAVVQVGEEMKVVAQNEIDNMKKALQDDHQKAMDTWKAAKKAAEDKKEKFDKPEPKAAALQVVKGGFKSQDEANTFLTSEKAKGKDKKDKEKKDDKKEKEKGK